jgi:HlyD family secretion protein
MSAANKPVPPRDRWRMRPLLFLGYFTVFTLVFGLGAWAAVTKIAGAVVSTGNLEVEGKKQVIQHPTGGVIAAINARNGDEVAEGQVLIELDGEDLGPELDTVEGQWFEIIARKSRLDAERDLLADITFHPELMARKDDPKIAELTRAQQQQFDARRKLQGEEAAQLKEQQVQIAKQNEGLEALGRSTEDQIDLVTKEITAQQTLMDQGLTQMTRLLTPQRELARLQGTAGQVEASLAENRGKIAELEIELVRLTSKVREEAIAELRELEFREIELREKRRSLKEQIARLDLRAPSSGIVYGSTVDTLRGVIRPAEPVMYVVPKDAPLVVKVRVETIHIDQVHPGQEAMLRFSAFDARTTPEVTGHVVSVSADAYLDEKLGHHYYEAEIALDEGQQERLDHVTLLPGMPVEAFIRTTDRSALSYFVKPMSDYFTRAFREG